MSQDPRALQLPYLLRDMLRFEQGTTFVLRIAYRAFTTNPFSVTGITREGLFKFNVIPVIDDAISVVKFKIPDIPIWVSVIDKNNAMLKSDMYANVSLEINDDKLHVLTAGYIYGQQAISWPVTDIERPEELKGAIVAVTASTPAPGANWSTATPAGQSWRILSCNFTLTTDANIALRRIHIIFRVGGNNAFEVIASQDQTASNTLNYKAMPTGSGATLSDGSTIIIPIPDNLIIPTGENILSAIRNLQVGDQISNVILTVERFVTLGDYAL